MSIGAIAVPAVPGAGALSVPSQQSTTNQTMDTPRQQIQMLHQLMIPIWMGIQQMLQRVHMTGVNIDERRCTEIEVLSLACAPFVDGNIELKKPRISVELTTRT